MYLSNTLYIPYWQYYVLPVCRYPVYGSWSCTAPLRNATEQQSTSELSSFTMNCSSLIRYPDTFKDLKTRLDTSDNYIITISFPGWHHFIPRLTPLHSHTYSYCNNTSHSNQNMKASSTSHSHIVLRLYRLGSETLYRIGSETGWKW